MASEDTRADQQHDRGRKRACAPETHRPSELAGTTSGKDRPFKWCQDDWDPFWGEKKRKERKELLLLTKDKSYS